MYILIQNKIIIFVDSHKWLQAASPSKINDSQQQIADDESSSLLEGSRHTVSWW